MIPEIGDTIKWRLGLFHDIEDHYNKVVRIEPCKFPFWFSTYWKVYLDNGEWIREQDVLEVVEK